MSSCTRNKCPDLIIERQGKWGVDRKVVPPLVFKNYFEPYGWKVIGEAPVRPCTCKNCVRRRRREEKAANLEARQRALTDSLLTF